MTSYSLDYIVSDPDVKRGRPRIRGTGITVHNIVEDRNKGMTVEQIAEAFDLTLAQIHAALAYYYDHKDQVDHDLQDDEQRNQQSIAKHGDASAANWQRIRDRLNTIHAEGENGKQE